MNRYAFAILGIGQQKAKLAAMLAESRRAAASARLWGQLGAALEVAA